MVVPWRGAGAEVSDALTCGRGPGDRHRGWGQTGDLSTWWARSIVCFHFGHPTVHMSLSQSGSRSARPSNQLGSIPLRSPAARSRPTEPRRCPSCRRSAGPHVRPGPTRSSRSWLDPAAGDRKPRLRRGAWRLAGAAPTTRWERSAGSPGRFEGGVIEHAPRAPGSRARGAGWERRLMPWLTSTRLRVSAGCHSLHPSQLIMAIGTTERPRREVDGRRPPPRGWTPSADPTSARSVRSRSAGASDYRQHRQILLTVRSEVRGRNRAATVISRTATDRSARGRYRHHRSPRGVHPSWPSRAPVSPWPPSRLPEAVAFVRPIHATIGMSIIGTFDAE